MPLSLTTYPPEFILEVHNDNTLKIDELIKDCFSCEPVKSASCEAAAKEMSEAGVRFYAFDFGASVLLTAECGERMLYASAIRAPYEVADFLLAAMEKFKSDF